MISVPTLVLPGSEELWRTGHFESRVVGNLVIACLALEWKRKSCFTNGNSKEQNSGAGPASAWSWLAEDRSWILVLLYCSLGPGLCQELATYPRRGKLDPGRQDSFLPVGWITQKKIYITLLSRGILLLLLSVDEEGYCPQNPVTGEREHVSQAQTTSKYYIALLPKIHNQ